MNSTHKKAILGVLVLGIVVAVAVVLIGGKKSVNTVSAGGVIRIKTKASINPATPGYVVTSPPEPFEDTACIITNFKVSLATIGPENSGLLTGLTDTSLFSGTRLGPLRFVASCGFFNLYEATVEFLPGP